MICNMNILARELDRADDVIDPGLFIASDTISTDAIEAAKQEFYRVLPELIDDSFENYSLGMPFAYNYYSEKENSIYSNQVYGFPIWHNSEEIYGIMEMILNDDGNYFTVINPGMLTSLSQLINQTTVDKPFSIFCYANTTYAISAEKEIILFEIPESSSDMEVPITLLDAGNDIKDLILEKQQLQQTVNVTDVIETNGGNSTLAIPSTASVNVQ